MEGATLTVGSNSVGSMGGNMWTSNPNYTGGTSVAQFASTYPIYSTPKVELVPRKITYETADTFVFIYALPGVLAEDLNAYIRNDELVIELGAREYLFNDLVSGISIPLLTEYNEENISLNIKDGVLEVEIKKAKPDKILVVK